ncbi:hypothetical protein SOM46_08195 [Pseudomonas fluorescens]|uniref:hypothetical protein n=1 Tax=Pseudomonas fluorescens TaxID=294 RepID=UPI00177D526C|nr:hypothetical protein [Pseudomonas fluorescens]MBD8235851.1 hypothetical protein [Pseudomonas fluorescens]MDY0894933.1 hypothetical protein [Pseudomonas fluorescens]
MAKDQGRGDMPNELRAGVWKSGDLIFSENQWVQYLGISRMTVTVPQQDFSANESI